MDLLLNATTASFEVACPLGASRRRILKHAQLLLTRLPRKRRRAHRNDHREFGCLARLIIWEATDVPGSLDAGKSLTKLMDSERIVSSWDGPCKILTVATVMELPILKLSTWVAIAVAKGNENHGLLLARIGQHGIEKERLIAMEQAPLQAVILRGPRVFIRTASALILCDSNGEELQCELPIDKKCHQIIGRTERDTEALLLNFQPIGGSSYGLCMTAFSYDGTAVQYWKTSASMQSISTDMVASFDYGVVIIVDMSSGYCVGMMLRTGSTIWKGRISEEPDQVEALCLFKGMLLLTVARISELLCLKVAECANTADTILPVTRLFRQKCCAADSATHDHFYVQWRDSVLQLHGVTGTCCGDEHAAEDEYSVTGVSDCTPSLSLLSQNLERRVNAGVKCVTSFVARRDDKRRILAHIRNLVLADPEAAVRNGPSYFFQKPLMAVLLSGEEPYEHSTTPVQESDDRPNDKAFPSPCSEPNHADTTGFAKSFLKLVGSEIGVDESSQFVIINLKVKLLAQPDCQNVSSVQKIAVQLEVELDGLMPTIWAFYDLENLRYGDTFWIGGYSSILSVASTAAFPDLKLQITAVASDGRVQRLGAFAISSILSRVVDTQRVAGMVTGHQFPFLQTADIIAEGRGTQNLYNFIERSKSLIPRLKLLQKREQILLMRAPLSCGTALVTTLARMRANVDDEVTFRNTTKLASPSLARIDDMLLSFEDEMRISRDIGARQEVFGYTSSDVRRIMEKQMLVDEDFGLLEEWHLRA